MPPGTPPTLAPATESAIVEWIAHRGRAVVALSGGVDSALVASFAYQALGTEALAVTVTGAAFAAHELQVARSVAQSIGIHHLAVPGDPLSDAAYRRNGPDRCYRCRRVETAVLRDVGAAHKAVQYLDGIHLDDLTDERPGLRAMDEAGVGHPLLWARWTKERVRESARSRGLPNWDRPSDACLASRVGPGEPISVELLERVATAEAIVREQGFRRVRVRVRSGAARIEVDPDEVERLSSPSLAVPLQERLRGLGFESVTIDPRGYGARPALPIVR